MIRARVIVPPAPIVSYEGAVARLRLAGGEDERAAVEGMIAGATADIDGPGGWLNRALGQQTLEVDFDRFDDLSRELPWPEVASIEAVSYLDGFGGRVTLAAGAYELLGGRVVPVIGTSWPAGVYARGDRGGAVRVRYVTGYETVPANVTTAVLMSVGAQYRDREGGVFWPDGALRSLNMAQVYR